MKIGKNHLNKFININIKTNNHLNKLININIKTHNINIKTHNINIKIHYHWKLIIHNINYNKDSYKIEANKENIDLFNNNNILDK